MVLEHPCFKLTHDTEVLLYFPITSAACARVGQLHVTIDFVRSCFRRCAAVTRAYWYCCLKI